MVKERPSADWLRPERPKSMTVPREIGLREGQFYSDFIAVMQREREENQKVQISNNGAMEGRTLPLN